MGRLKGDKMARYTIEAVCINNGIEQDTLFFYFGAENKESAIEQAQESPDVAEFDSVYYTCLNIK